MTIDTARLRALAERYASDDADEDLDAEKWGEAFGPFEALAILDKLDAWERIAERDHGAPIETVQMLRKQVDDMLVMNDELTAELSQLRKERDGLEAGLIKACSMLDDAVQFREDAEQWFVGIDGLRRIAIPNLRPMAGYIKDDE